ncbi:ABC transporter ATP-binding protein [Blastococcus sp. SYSU DS0617]
MLALHHISKRYGPHLVLDDVGLEVPRGAIVGYVGGNGAGKTTSMRIVLGVATADAGHVTLDGAPVDAELRARMGYMPEERGLYPTMRVQQQLQFFAELRGLSRAGAAHAARYWLDRLGLEERRDSALEDLSLGNQQRVQLAAALVHEPDALVLDEPFSGLDPLAVDVMSQVLREEADRGIPVLFSSHQLELVERTCDRVAILKGGRLVADGAVDDLTGGDGHRYLLRSDADPATWAHDLDPAVRVSIESVADDAVTVRLTGDSYLQELVDAVRRHGTLRELRPWRPSLTQVYRDVVDVPGQPQEAHTRPTVEVQPS